MICMGSFTRPLAASTWPEMSNLPTAPVNSAGAPGGNGRTSTIIGELSRRLWSPEVPVPTVKAAELMGTVPTMVGNRTVRSSTTRYSRESTVSV